MLHFITDVILTCKATAAGKKSQMFEKPGVNVYIEEHDVEGNNKTHG